MDFSAIEKKMDEYAKRVENGESFNSICKELFAYLEAIDHSIDEPIVKGYVRTIKLIYQAFNVIDIVNNNLSSKLDKTNSKLNNALGRIKKLEERFDKLDSYK